MTGKTGRYVEQAGERPPQGASRGSVQVSKTYTKNEPVAGRNIYHRARPWLGAKLAPWLWTGGTKEVRTHGVVILVDTGGSQP